MSKYSNSNYPKVNYIGNKDKLTNWIIDNMPVKEGKVLDLFCGGCSISYALKENGYTVHSNDALYSSYVIAKSLIENKKTRLSKYDYNIEIDKEELLEINDLTKNLRNKLYYSKEIDELNKLICISKKLKGYKKYLFLSLLRRSMIRKIPYSRMNVKWSEIKKFRDEDYLYKKYKRRRSYQNEPFINHINKEIDEYNNAIFDNGKENKVFQKDCFKLIKNTKEMYDVIYLDPPYPGTMNNYNEFYGYFDTIFDKEIKYTNIISSDKFIKYFEELICLCLDKTRYLLISLNINNNFDYNGFISMIKKYGKVKIKKHKYQYKTTGKNNKNNGVEVLIIVNVNDEKN